MASKGALDVFINALPTEIRYPVRGALYYLADNWRLGTQPRAQNAQWYRVQSTTASVAGTEFSIPHGLGSAPHTLVPILDLSAVNSQIVPLTVSRAPDASRVYLTSSSTSAVFTCFLEA